MSLRELRRRTRHLSFVVSIAGVLMAGLTLAAAAFFARYEFAEILTTDKEQGELQARVLADHAARSVDTASVVLTYIASQLQNADVALMPQRASEALPPALAALPFVRGIAVLDANGWVLGSSQDAEVGHQFTVDRLGPLPAADSDMLGPYVAGRNLLESTTSGASRRPGVGFIPLIRAVRAQGGQILYLVALLNPDSFSNFQVLTLHDPHSSAYLLSYAGQVLASSGEKALPPGDSASFHPILRQLSVAEHEVAVEEGISPGRRVLAYRLSKTRPLLSVVEQRYEDTVQRWYDAMRWLFAATVLAVVFILALTWLMLRSLRARTLAQTELNQAQKQVEIRERDLSILVRSVQELIFRTDLQGRITYVNDRWHALSGQRSEDALGQSLEEMVDPEDWAHVAALFDPDSDNGVRQASVSLRAFDAVVHRLDIAVVRLRGTEGFAGSAVDVTARYAAQQALQHQLAFVALLFEISPLPVATLDADGRYVTVNQAWEEFTGVVRDKVMGHRGAEVMSASDAAEHARQNAELWERGGSCRYEAKISHRDGTRRDVIVSKIRVDGDQYHASSLLTTIMDVSEFREAERAIQMARDAAEESSRAKSEFIANISHELRTPLQSILGFSELGVMRGKDTPKLMAMYEDIHTSGERMLALVNDLLDVSKIESAVGAIALERMDVQAVVRDVLPEFRPQLAERQLRFEVDMGPGALLAKADPVRLAQVVRNVVANAIKFSPRGSSIEVKGRLEVAAREICISVRDHGVGIPGKELEKIFEAFVQSSTTKDGSGGTGLGLAICKKIMEAHGGRIVASNMPDGGALFQIFLPARMSLDQETVF